MRENTLSSKRSEAKRLFAEAKKEFGPVDVLVNNAGVAQIKLFTDITDDDYDRMFDCNVRSVFNCCQLALPDMIHKKQGRIINVSSMWGITGASCEVHYSGFDKETLEALKEETPVGRIGTPEDVARAILFLADEKSSFITGQTFGVDGAFI